VSSATGQSELVKPAVGCVRARPALVLVHVGAAQPLQCTNIAPNLWESFPAHPHGLDYTGGGLDYIVNGLAMVRPHGLAMASLFPLEAKLAAAWATACMHYTQPTHPTVTLVLMQPVTPAGTLSPGLGKASPCQSQPLAQRGR
jgi:hypothetical protein